MILKIYLRSDASKIKSSEITDYQYHDIEYILKVNIDITRTWIMHIFVE